MQKTQVRALAHYRNPLSGYVMLILGMMLASTFLIRLLVTQPSFRVVILFFLAVCLLGIVLLSIDAWHLPYLILVYEDGLFIERYAGSLMVPWHAVTSILIQQQKSSRRRIPSRFFCHLSIQFEEEQEQVIIIPRLKQQSATANDPSPRALGFEELIQKMRQETGL